MIVLDASATVEYLTDPAAVGEWVRTRVEEEDEIAAPHLLDVEVVSAIRKRLMRKDLSNAAAENALADFSDLAITRYPMAELLPRLWDLRRTLTPYDASYVALAEALRAPLVTTDMRLARSRSHRAEVVAFRA